MLGKGWWIVVVLMLAGCTVGPKYKRPQVAVPDAYRGSLLMPTRPAPRL